MPMPQSIYAKIRSDLSNHIEKAATAAGYKDSNPEATIDFSKNFGDISSSVSFRLAKLHNKNPDAIANSIKEKIGKIDFVKEISVEKGFINFHLDRQAFTALLLVSTEKHQTKDALEKKPEKVIIEYISVNPNKPWHIGHLRNALLGDSISNFFSYLGYSVERENYIDDLGLQMAESLYWYLNKDNKPDKKFDQWLGEQYVKVNEHLNEEEVKIGVSKILSLMNQHGTYEAKILRDLVTACIMAQYETAFSYRIYQDLLVWESDIVREKLLERAMEILHNYGFVKKPKDGDYANCTIIDLASIKELPAEFKGLKENAKVLIRSDGTPTYIAKDIAFHMWKFGIIENNFKYSKFTEQPNAQSLYTTSQDGKKMDFANAQIAINIIDSRQSHPQSMIKLIFAAMGKSDLSNNMKHLAYGEVELESGSLSGRKGTWFGYSADDLLRETQQKAGGMINSRLNLEKTEQEKIAGSVALGAIKFEFLRMGPEKKIIFSWDKALNFEGNSGPYAQYMHARATRIIEDFGNAADKSTTPNISELPEISDAEFTLVKLLSKEYNTIEKAAMELRPNVVTEYINELAYAFASFYEQSPILKAKSEQQKNFRIRLTISFRTTMKRMLSLIGIEALERM